MTFFVSLAQPDPRHYGERITIMSIAIIRSWLARMGLRSTFIIEAVEEGRNRVLLRVFLKSATADVEVAWLCALRRRRLSEQAVLAQLQERVRRSEPTVA